MIVGIDFSIKSCAITVLRDDGYHFSTFARNSIMGNALSEDLAKSSVHILSLEDEPGLPKNSSITDRERSSTKDGIMQATAIADFVLGMQDDTEIKVAFEGFSFGSKGNRLAQISGYQWLVRNALIEKCGLQLNNLWFFSPMTVKATAGKGNFNKEQMIDAFCKENFQHPFLQKIQGAPSTFQNKKGGWLKPIDDICDSYWVAATLIKTLSNM